MPQHLNIKTIQLFGLIIFLTTTINSIYCIPRLCPTGGYILRQGLSEKDKQDAVDAHNKVRQMMVDGEVCNQPRAKSMQTLVYDESLAVNCIPVSNQCVMRHIPVNDSRWDCVGQNIYINWRTQLRFKQDWEAAVFSWWNECNDFRYPFIKLDPNKQTGHYTQVVWANTNTIGCDCITFIDKNKPTAPYCTMYTCNYGPCGNWLGYPPYEIAEGCEGSWEIPVIPDSSYTEWVDEEDEECDECTDEEDTTDDEEDEFSSE